MPEAKEKWEAGSLTLTAVVEVQKAINRQKKTLKLPVPKEKAQELLKLVENTTQEATLKVLKSEFPESFCENEQLRRISKEEFLFRITVDEETHKNLMRAKEVLSHMHPLPQWKLILGTIVKKFLR